MLCLFDEKSVKKIKECFDNTEDVCFFALNDEEDILKKDAFFVHEKYDCVFLVDDMSEKSRKLIDFWTGHNHFRYKKSFDEILREISHVLKTSLEIEKKFLIKYPDISYLDSLKNARAVTIEQSYLEENGTKIRIRKRGFDGQFSYYQTIKRNIDGFKKEEIEISLTKDEYEGKLKKSNGFTISKTRYCISENYTCYEIDIYPFWNDKATLEIELTDENEEYIILKNITVIKDVSEDKAYSNYNLSKLYKK